VGFRSWVVFFFWGQSWVVNHKGVNNVINFTFKDKIRTTLVHFFCYRKRGGGANNENDPLITKNK
jgi:hypothetical protein